MKIFTSFIFAMVFAFSFSTAVHLTAQSADQKKKKPVYRKARVLQASTAKKIVKIVEALEEMDDEGNEAPDWNKAKEILTELYNKRSEMKSYDRSVMWNYWGYIYFSEEKYDQAMNAYEMLLNEPEATIPLRTSSLLTLAQLNMVNEDYDRGIELILQWMDEVEKITAQSHYLLSQAYFNKEDYRKATSSAEEAIRFAMEEEGYRPKENWYVLLAACYGMLAEENVITKEESLQKRLPLYEVLIEFYPKKNHFISLGGIYSQLDRERDFMLTLKTAYMKDLLDKETEYTSLAQLMLLYKTPYWAAQVLVDGQNKKVLVKNEETEEEELKPVVSETFKNLKLLADAWRMAQEIDKAIPVLEKAASLDEKGGETYILLGNLYLFEDRIEDAIIAIENGLKKGNLKKESQAHLVLGQAFFELEKFDDAKKYFRLAARDEDKVVKKTANNWIRYSENEEVRLKNLALRREFIEQNS